MKHSYHTPDLVETPELPKVKTDKKSSRRLLPIYVLSLNTPHYITKSEDSSLT